MNQLQWISLMVTFIISLIAKNGLTKEIIEFSTDTSSCPNVDNSTNITITCTLYCDGGPYPDEAKIRVFDTFYYPSIKNAKLAKDSSTLCQENTINNATRVVSGTISQTLRNNSCFFSAECHNLDSSIIVTKTFQYSDCGINQQCSPTAASTTITPAPTSCSAVPSITTVSSNVTVTETETYSVYCPGSTTELNTTTLIPTITITASVSSGLTTSATRNEPNATVSIPTSLLCSNLAISTVISTYTTTVTTSASTSSPPETITNTVTTIAGLGAGSGTLVLIIAVSVLINVALCMKVLLHKRKNKSKTQDVPVQSLRISNPGYVESSTFPPFSNDKVNDSPAAPPTSNMK